MVADAAPAGDVDRVAVVLEVAVRVAAEAGADPGAVVPADPEVPVGVVLGAAVRADPAVAAARAAWVLYAAAAA